MVFSSVRKLPLQHMSRVVKARRDGLHPDIPPLNPNEMQLYSFYRPGLVAGDYEVTVIQEIDAIVPDPKNEDGGTEQQKLVVQNVRSESPAKVAVQQFQVVVPRFTLDPKLVSSYYPPDGHQDQGNVLPHIVLNDPHYPWEIDAGSTPGMHDLIDGGRNLVPWVALVVFDPDDLRIPTMPEITALNVPSITDVNQQSNKGTFSMQARQYFETPDGSHVDFEKGYGNDVKLWSDVSSATDPCQIIFPTKQLFYDIFNDPETMKYMSHVRNVNTTGCPNAGIDEMGLFSVIVSSRTGRYDSPAPMTQICHLVSIENVDSTLPATKAWLDTKLADRTGSDRIGLISLFSWVYTALPPDPINFVDTMRSLVETQQMFRADQSVLLKLNGTIPATPSGAPPSSRQILHERLGLGYTLARWRTESGEETTAWNRGPLVPQRVKHWQLPEGDAKPLSIPMPDLPDCSNTSKEFQILDRYTGLMDLSYSSAWQLGKTLAISDTVFSGALMRFRSTLHNAVASRTRAEVNGTISKDVLLQKLVDHTSHVRKLSQGMTAFTQRLQSPSMQKMVADVKSPEAAEVFTKHLNGTIQTQMSAGTEPFHNFNINPANNNDWAIVHNWLEDRLSLADIPPHYLIPEPSFLPPEGIRFFYIDDNWLDCLIDGALSVANHLDAEDDLIRIAIKQGFNDYLRAEVGATGIKPQIPGYGFILRSQVVKAIPDLRIEVVWKVPDPADHQRHPVCRYTRFDDTTLLCLLDRWPEEIDYIKLGQPLHQQCFSLGFNLTAAAPATKTAPAQPRKLEAKLLQLYTSNPPDGQWPPLLSQPPPEVTDDWFNWDTRCLNLRSMTSKVNELLQNPGIRPYKDSVPNSCELGLELNDPAYFFRIRPSQAPLPPDHQILPRDRQLYVNLGADAAQAPKSTAAVARFTANVAHSPSLTARQLPEKFSKTVLPERSINEPPRPHVQHRAQPVPSSLLAVRNIRDPLALANQPTSQFDLAVYADYRPFPSKLTEAGYDPQAYIPTKNVFYFDLIFSVRRSERSSLSLVEIQFDIPKALKEVIPPEDPSPKQDPNQEPLLQYHYDGAGVRMLANQRFIPYLFTDTAHLRVQLLPRTAAERFLVSLNDDTTSDLSFRLAEANIAHLQAGQYLDIAGSPGEPGWRGKCQVTMVEIYSTPAGDWPVTTVIDVVKKPIRDTEDVRLEHSA